MGYSEMSGTNQYIVKAGDCISSIAHKHGLPWKKLWDFNQELKQKRRNPNILLIGDVVKIPPVEEKQVRVATGSKHTFQLRGATAPLTLRLKAQGRPRSGLRYTLQIEGWPEQRNTTDKDGFIRAQVPSWVRAVKLTLHTNAGPEHYELRLGQLDPFDEIRGVQQRLSNLGISCPTTGSADEATRQAVRIFQSRIEGLENSGDPMDSATQDALRAAHGS